jgi:hypothetical protein
MQQVVMCNSLCCTTEIEISERKYLSKAGGAPLPQTADTIRQHNKQLKIFDLFPSHLPDSDVKQVLRSLPHYNTVELKGSPSSYLSSPQLRHFISGASKRREKLWTLCLVLAAALPIAGSLPEA